MDKLAVGSSNVVEINDLTNTVSGEYVDDATITMTVRDLQTGDPVVGAVWPVDLTPVGSGGRYRVVLDSFLELNRNRQYILDIDAATATEQSKWQTRVSAVMEE